MKYKFPSQILTVLGVAAVGATIASWWGAATPSPTMRDLHIEARQYAYEPAVIRVNEGDTLRITLTSMDVVHGFYLEGHNLDAEVHADRKGFMVRYPDSDSDWKEVAEAMVVADRRGKFRYRCSHTCGSMHPFMLGELIVEPNTPYHASVGALLGLFVGFMLTIPRGTVRKKASEAN